jgi:hypothetical protein
MYYFIFKKCFADKVVFQKDFFRLRNFFENNFKPIEVQLKDRVGFHVSVDRRLYCFETEDNLNFFLTVFSDIAQRVDIKSPEDINISHLDKIRQ